LPILFAYATDASEDGVATIATIGRQNPLIGKKIPSPQKYRLVVPLKSVLATANDLVRNILRPLSKIIKL
jgi:hypothetical protein